MSSANAMTAEQLLTAMADQLGRAREHVWHDCECEICGQCGRTPAECSGTECAATCQCSTCDFCAATSLIDAGRRLAARLSGMAAVPEGWKLVPVAPTYEMLLAADSELMREPRIGMVRGRSPARVYAAMLTAAPEPPHV